MAFSARWTMRRPLRTLLVTLAAAGTAAGAAAYYHQRVEGQVPSLRTTQLRRGDLVFSISATGNVEPEEVIDVGAQVAGQIVSFGTDGQGKMVDYGSSVRERQYWPRSMIPSIERKRHRLRRRCSRPRPAFSGRKPILSR